MQVEFESFGSTYEEATPLITSHWNEVPFGKWPEIGVDVNVANYLMMEDAGYLRLVTARDDGKLVGYLVLLCHEMNHHTGIWQVASDVVYVDPAYRGKGVMDMMLQRTMQECKELGVKFYSICVNPNFDFSKLLERNGAVLTEKTYTWNLEE